MGQLAGETGRITGKEAVLHVKRHRQIKQRYRTAYGKHSRLYCIAQLDRAAENRAGVHKILRNKVSIPLFA